MTQFHDIVFSARNIGSNRQIVTAKFLKLHSFPRLASKEITTNIEGFTFTRPHTILHFFLMTKP